MTRGPGALRVHLGARPGDAGAGLGDPLRRARAARGRHGDGEDLCGAAPGEAAGQGGAGWLLA